MPLYEYGYVVQTAVDEATLLGQIAAAGLPAPVAVQIEGVPTRVSVGLGYDAALTDPELITLSGIFDTYTPGLPAQWVARWHVEDPPQQGKVMAASDYQDYDPGTSSYSNLVRQYAYTWAGNVFLSTTITEFGADGAVLSVRTEPVYTSSVGGRVTPVEGS